MSSSGRGSFDGGERERETSYYTLSVVDVEDDEEEEDVVKVIERG